MLAVFIEQLKVAKPRAYGSHYPEISSAIQEAIQAAVSGQAPVADALNAGPGDDHPASAVSWRWQPLMRASRTSVLRRR